MRTCMKNSGIQMTAAINLQAPEAISRGDGSLIDLHSLFMTLQGEGPFTGQVALFIRLAGCSLQCPSCDTEYTQGRRSLYYGDVIQEAAIHLSGRPCGLIVITGGEPTRQNLSMLLPQLAHATGCHIQIESNGMHPLPDAVAHMIAEGKCTWIVSPKTSHIHADTRMASAFKYVIEADSVREEDGLPIKALGHKAKPYVARPPEGWFGPIYVNPMDAKDEAANALNTQACVLSAMMFGYICGHQAHKMWNLP